jgi:hypothetical protein
MLHREITLFWFWAEVFQEYTVLEDITEKARTLQRIAHAGGGIPAPIKDGWPIILLYSFENNWPGIFEIFAEAGGAAIDRLRAKNPMRPIEKFYRNDQTNFIDDDSSSA